MPDATTTGATTSFLKVEIKGVVIPTWLAACFATVSLCSVLALLLVWESRLRIEREIRILQVHAQDIQNVLVRQGIASRTDFISNSSPNTSAMSKDQHQNNPVDNPADSTSRKE